MNYIGEKYDVFRHSPPPGAILTPQRESSGLSDHEHSNSGWRIARHVAEVIIVIGSFGFLGMVPGLIAATISLADIGLYFRNELK